MCFGLLASYRDEKQRRAHSCRATVERLLTVSQPSDYHADTLRKKDKARSLIHDAQPVILMFLNLSSN